MSVKLKEYFDYDNEHNIKPRTTMRYNRWFISIGDRHYGSGFKPPTNYYDDRDGLVDGKMLFENNDGTMLPMDILLPELKFMALGPVGDLIETTTFKNVIIIKTNVENVFLLKFDAFEYKKG